jgi:hypothetical protein
MTATIDGASFEAVFINVGAGAPSTINVVGTSDASASTVTQVSIYVDGVTGPGTFPLDSGALPDGIALVTVTTASTPSQWSTTTSAGPGSVTITSLSASHATGTFQFVAEPDAGTAATGQISVTSGAFDISF